MASFVRTVELAERADAEINITWQGSTFEFAMRNMPRFADELASLVRLHGIERLWVTMFNEPNTTGRTLAEYEQVYRSLHRLLVERGVRDRIRFMGGDLTRSEQGASQAEWLRYMASRMGDLLDAWSVHVYWDFWDTGKIDQRLLAEVRSIVGSIPPEQHRPIYITEFGVRGLGTFEGEVSFDPGFWPDGTGMSATEMSAFQHAWFNLRAAQLGYSGTVKWDVYPAKYDAGTQDFSALGPGAEGWPARPVYNLLQLLGRTTEPRRRAHRRGDRRPGCRSRKAGDRIRLAGERLHDPRPPHGRWCDTDDLARAGHIRARRPSREQQPSGSSSGTVTATARMSTPASTQPTRTGQSRSRFLETPSSLSRRHRS